MSRGIFFYINKNKSPYGVFPSLMEERGKLWGRMPLFPPPPPPPHPQHPLHIVYNTNNKLYDDDKMGANHEYPEDQECLLVFNNSFDVSVSVSRYLPLKELLNNNTINNHVMFFKM